MTAKTPSFLIVFLTLLVFFSTSHAIEGCSESGEHASVTYLLIDRSDKLENTDNLDKSLGVVKDMIPEGERLIVGVSTGKASDTRVLMDFVKPKNSIWTSKLKTRATEQRFSSCLMKVKTKVTNQNEEHKHSALLETLNVVSKALKADSSPKKRVIIYSDMIQNSPAISFYGKATVEASAMLAKIEKEFLLSDFKGMEIHVSGVGTGTSDKKARSIENFWNKFFEKSGANLKFYGPVLFSS